jgi:hypothetical protein
MAPIAIAVYYFSFICGRDEYITQTLGCISNSVVAVLLLWGIPGIIVAMLSPFFRRTLDLSRRTFFNLPLSIVLIILALLLRGIMSLTCGCVVES